MDDSTDSEDQTDDTEEEQEPAYDIESYRHALTEARRTLDQQLQAFNDVNEKAWRIVQLNGLIATVYVTAVANALDGLTFSVCSILLVALGLSSMGVSVLLASEGQKATTVNIGQSAEAFESLRSNDPPEIKYLYRTLEDYESWISQVNEKTEINGTTVNRAKRLSIIGVVFITVGSILAFVQ
ncbi:hypothetical protein V9T20_05860 [Halobacterium salinarum]|uniref:hypothetical protein n=1 Tax=Halobacterium salinarum TaxID=2242 RepID=UPI0030CFAFCB